MIANRRMVLAAVALVCLTGSSVFAGGNGGSKRDSKIEVQNNSQTQVGVLINPSSQQLENAQNATTVAQFRAAGGTVINAGANRSFKAKVGASQVYLVDLSTADILYQDSLDVGKGATKRLTVDNNLNVTEEDRN